MYDMNVKGKVVDRVNFYRREGLDVTTKCQAVLIQFTDGSEIVVDPLDNAWVKLTLIEPTLNSDVISIGTDTLGEGSIE